jgi:hypothetical protein
LSLSLALSLALALSLPRVLALSLALRAPQHLDFPSYNLGGIAFLALRVFPLVSANTAFNIDLAAFGEVISTKFSRLAEGDDTVPFRSILPFAFPGRDRIVCCEVEFCNGDSTCAVSDIRISPQSADKYNFIDRASSHFNLSFLAK